MSISSLVTPRKGIGPKWGAAGEQPPRRQSRAPSDPCPQPFHSGAGPGDSEQGSNRAPLCRSGGGSHPPPDEQGKREALQRRPSKSRPGTAREADLEGLGLSALVGLFVPCCLPGWTRMRACRALLSCSARRLKKDWPSGPPASASCPGFSSWHLRLILQSDPQPPLCPPKVPLGALDRDLGRQGLLPRPDGRALPGVETAQNCRE